MLRTLLLTAAALQAILAAAQSVKPDGGTIQITSRIVYVDVTVRDSGGNIVHGLAQNDFQVFEDSRPQQIDYFTEHVYNPGSPGVKPASGLDFSNTSTPGHGSAVTILLLDLLNTSTQEQLTAREQMLKFLSALPPGRPISLFTLTNKLQMIQSFTGSPELLTAAATMLKPTDLGQLPSREEVKRDQDTAAEFDAQSSPIHHSPSGSTAMDGNIQTQDTDLNPRTYTTIAALTQLVQMMGSYQGRKNLFWVSETFPVALNTKTNFLGQQLPVDARRMSNLLSNARIAVYPVSVLGLDQGYAPTNVIGPSEWYTFHGRGNLKSAMDDIAKQTGGQAIVGTNDLAGAMRHDLDDSANYYTLAYQPQNKRWNQQFRNIGVELTQKGDTLSYRRGYFAFPDTAPAQTPAQQLNAALHPEMPESTTLALQAKVDLPTTQDVSVRVHAALNPSNLALITGADGHHRGQIFVALIALNDTAGQETGQSDPPPQSSGVLNLDFDAAQYQAVLKSGIAFTQKLNLPPGRYRLRLGVCDVISNRLGTLDMPIVIP